MLLHRLASIDTGGRRENNSDINSSNNNARITKSDVDIVGAGGMKSVRAMECLTMKDCLYEPMI